MGVCRQSTGLMCARCSCEGEVGEPFESDASVKVAGYTDAEPLEIECSQCIQVYVHAVSPHIVTEIPNRRGH